MTKISSLLNWLILRSSRLKPLFIASFCFALAEIIIALSHRAVIPWFTLILLFIFEFILSFAVILILFISVNVLLIPLKQSPLRDYFDSIQILIITLSMPLFFCFYLLNTKALARLSYFGFQRLFFNGLFLFLAAALTFLATIIFKKYSFKMEGLNFWTACFLWQIILPAIHFFFFSSIPFPDSSAERFRFLLALSIPLFPIVWLLSYLNWAIKNPSISKISFIFLVLIFLSSLIFISPYFNFELSKSLPQPKSKLKNHLRPNIILVVWDSGRKDRYSIYGHSRSTTPRLAELAGDGYIFQKAYTVSPWTLPSVASMFTGLYPSQHQAEHFNGKSHSLRPLGAEALTLAEILNEQGYQTAAWTANHGVLNSWFGLHQGFNFYFDERPHLFDLLSVHLLGRLDNYAFVKLFINPSYLSSEINRRLLPWIKKKLNSPFFLYIHYMDPHGINYLPHPYRGLFGGKQKVPSAPIKDILEGREKIDPQVYEEFLSRYDEEIAFCDANFGKLIDLLKQLNFYHQSLIIVTSDHGQALGEHNFFGHRSALYEEILQIPLVIKFPEEKKSSINPGRPIENRELFFLILEEAGIKLSDACPRALLDEEGIIYTVAEATLPASTAPGIGLEENSKRFQEDFLGTRVAITRHAPPHPKLILSSTGKDALYLLDEDPKEQTNQLDKYQALANNLRLFWMKWQPSLQKYSLEKKEEKIMTKEIIERLRSLGYIR